MERALIDAGQPYFVPPIAALVSPTRDEIVEAGFLANTGRPILLEVLAAPQPLKEASQPITQNRWDFPAGTLGFNRNGLVFATEGKRIGMLERALGGPLASLFANTGSKVAEHLGGGIVGETLASLSSTAIETKELVERFTFLQRGVEHRESLAIPIDRIVCLSQSFEKNNRYGKMQLNVTIAEEAETLTSFGVRWREEDDSRSFGDYTGFIYFLRLNYEQYHVQTLLLRHFAGPDFDIPGYDKWMLNAVAFEPNVYERARSALTVVGTTSLDDILNEALYHSRHVLPYVGDLVATAALERYAVRPQHFDGMRPLCLACFGRAEDSAASICADCGKAI